MVVGGRVKKLPIRRWMRLEASLRARPCMRHRPTHTRVRPAERQDGDGYV